MQFCFRRNLRGAIDMSIPKTTVVVADHPVRESVVEMNLIESDRDVVWSWEGLRHSIFPTFPVCMRQKMEVFLVLIFLLFLKFQLVAWMKHQPRLMPCLHVSKICSPRVKIRILVWVLVELVRNCFNGCIIVLTYNFGTYIYIYVCICLFSILLDTSVNVERIRYCKSCMHKFISECSFRLWKLSLMPYVTYVILLSWNEFWERICVCVCWRLVKSYLFSWYVCLVQRDYVLACARSRLWSLGLCVFLWAAAWLFRCKKRCVHFVPVQGSPYLWYSCGPYAVACSLKGSKLPGQNGQTCECGHVDTCDVLRFGSKRLRVLSASGGLCHELEIWVNFSCLAFRLR